MSASGHHSVPPPLSLLPALSLELPAEALPELSEPADAELEPPVSESVAPVPDSDALSLALALALSLSLSEPAVIVALALAEPALLEPPSVSVPTSCTGHADWPRPSSRHGSAQPVTASSHSPAGATAHVVPRRAHAEVRVHAGDGTMTKE
jgi:hypothetical protein